jgi:sarcosine oxidase
MTPRPFKVIIIGACGLVGSSAFYQAARHCADKLSTPFFKGPSVLAIDQFEEGHTEGSSHGESRITRTAIGEGDEYVQLAQRSHVIWNEIQALTGKQLINVKSTDSVGGLIIGPNDNPAAYHGSQGGFLNETTRIAKDNKISHQRLDNAALARTFPQFKVRDNDEGYCEDSMGYINPDACVKANIKLAQQHGGKLCLGEEVKTFENMADGKIRVITNKSSYITEKLIIAAGPWLSNLLGTEKTAELKVCRQTVCWFEVEKSQREQFTKDKFPTFIWSLDSDNIIYGFPLMGDSTAIKISTESFATVTTPKQVNRTVSEEEKKAIYEKFARYFPGITSNCVKAMTCLYTVAPNFRFVVDFLPHYNNQVIVASTCSGHGAKHAAAIGEALAQQSLLNHSQIPVIKIFGGLFSKQASNTPVLTMK